MDPSDRSFFGFHFGSRRPPEDSLPTFCLTPNQSCRAAGRNQIPPVSQPTPRSSRPHHPPHLRAGSEPGPVFDSIPPVSALPEYHYPKPVHRTFRPHGQRSASPDCRDGGTAEEDRSHLDIDFEEPGYGHPLSWSYLQLGRRFRRSRKLTGRRVGPGVSCFPGLKP